MSYKVLYKPTGKLEVKTQLWRKKYSKGVLCALVAVIMLAIASYSNIYDSIRNFIIPGDDDVTQAAFAEFGNSLKEGVGIGEALTTFCQEIIDNANIAQ